VVPVNIVFIAIACVLVLGIISWKLWQRRRAKLQELELEVQEVENESLNEIWNIEPSTIVWEVAVSQGFHI